MWASTSFWSISLEIPPDAQEPHMALTGNQDDHEIAQRFTLETFQGKDILSKPHLFEGKSSSEFIPKTFLSYMEEEELCHNPETET